MSFLKTVAATVDMVRGRFEAFEVDTDADHAACMAVLEQVRKHELNRVHGSSVLETAAFADRSVHDRLFATRDTKSGEIVGCVRCVDTPELADDEGARQEYLLHLVPDDVIAESQVLTRFAILRDYRKTAASLALFHAMFDRALDYGTLASFQACEPGLYRGYLRLGFRPLGPVHGGASGGFRIPMVSIHHDVEYFQRARSPLARKIRTWDGDKPDTAVKWFCRLEAEQGHIDTGVTFYSPDVDQAAYDVLAHGLSERGRDELFTNSMEIDCEPGQLILREGDGGRFLGLVSRGVVEVRVGDRTVAILGEGELFGEMAVALDGYRTANLVAASDDTRVVTLSRSCLARISRPEDQAQVWRNIARVLAERLRNVDR